MKKTLTINLNKTVFHIDEDAYELLQAYISDVSQHLKSETEKNEIMSDIEARIAELFTERLGKTDNVVTVEDVNIIVAIMGKPNQFVDETTEDEKSAQSQNDQSPKNRKSKRYYRDIDNRLLGGVAAGLAAFLNWDIAIIRIIFVTLAFVTSATFILIYLLMWLIVPKAITTAQKLEMHGEDVNIETIKNKMVDAKEYLESDKFKTTASRAGSRLIEIITVLFKILITTVGAIVSIVGVILIATLIFGLIVFLLEPDAITGLAPEVFATIDTGAPDKIILLIISMLLIIGCPIFTLIYWSLNVISKERKAKSYSGIWVSLILWISGILMFVATGAGTLKQLRKNNVIAYDKKISWQWQDGDETSRNAAKYVTEERSLPHFTAIDAGDAVKIELTQQAAQTLSVDAPGEHLPDIKTEVNNGVLKIYSTNRHVRSIVRIKIGTDTLTAIEISGTAHVDFKTPFKVKNLTIGMSGAGKSDLLVSSAQKLDIKLSGASKCDVQGVADTLLVNASGASYIDTDDLKTKIVKLNLSGASKAEVFAAEVFEGDAGGASQVSCSGNPAIRTNRISGGAIIKYN